MGVFEDPAKRILPVIFIPNGRQLDECENEHHQQEQAGEDEVRTLDEISLTLQKFRQSGGCHGIDIALGDVLFVQQQQGADIRGDRGAYGAHRCGKAQPAGCRLGIPEF